MTFPATWPLLALTCWLLVGSALRSTNASDPAIAAVTSRLKALAALPAEEWCFHAGDLHTVKRPT
jgi:hypothetical protein